MKDRNQNQKKKEKKPLGTESMKGEKDKYPPNDQQCPQRAKIL